MIHIIKYSGKSEQLYIIYLCVTTKTYKEQQEETHKSTDNKYIITIEEHNSRTLPEDGAGSDGNRKW